MADAPDHTKDAAGTPNVQAEAGRGGAARRVPRPRARRRRRVAVSLAVAAVIAVAVAVPVVLHRQGEAVGPRTGPFACPAGPLGRLPVEHRGTNDAIVPPGAVRATGCLYAGLNDEVRSGTLLRAVHVAEPGTAANRLNALPPFDPDGRPVSCPNDNGSRALVGFDYPDWIRDGRACGPNRLRGSPTAIARVHRRRGPLPTGRTRQATPPSPITSADLGQRGVMGAGITTL